MASNSSTQAQVSPEYWREDRGWMLLSTCIAMAVIDTSVMILLFVSRYYAKGERRSNGMDIFMTMAYLTCLGKITIATLMVKVGGTGRHSITLPPQQVRFALQLGTASQIVCPGATSLSKLGVLCLFNQILGKVGRRYRIAIRVAFVLVSSVLIVQVLVPFLNCRPFKKMWIPETPGTCAVTSLWLWRYMSTPNVTTTIIVVAIPVPALYKLHVSRAVKWGLGAVFVVCIIGIIAAVMRIQAFLSVTDFDDITWENVRPMRWTVAESGIYLTAGVMLTIRPLISKMCKGTRFEKYFVPSSGSSRSFGERASGRRWYRRSRPELVQVESKQERSMSGGTTEGLGMVRTNSSNAPKLGKDHDQV